MSISAVHNEIILYKFSIKDAQDSRLLTLFSPGGGGGFRSPPPPLDIFRDNYLTQENLALKFCDFFLLSLAHLLEEIFRKSDLPLQSIVSFCLCMSAPKSLIFVICVQNIWKSHFSNKEIKHWLFGLVYS